MNTIICFECTFCGKPAMYFPEGYYDKQEQLPPGAVGHSKPDKNIGIPDSTGCAGYTLMSPEAFWNANKNSKRLESPTSFKPILG